LLDVQIPVMDSPDDYLMDAMPRWEASPNPKRMRHTPHVIQSGGSFGPESKDLERFDV